MPAVTCSRHEAWRLGRVAGVAGLPLLVGGASTPERESNRAHERVQRLVPALLSQGDADSLAAA